MPKSNGRKNILLTRKKKAPALNAASIRRTSPTFEVDPKRIRVPDWMVGTDSIFLDLYRKYLQGRVPGFLTRVPLEMIKEGFYLPAEGFAYKCDAPPEEVVLAQVRAIQQGARRSLHLYVNKNPACTFRFLCPDDVAICLAYKRLKIRLVPAIVFGPGRASLPLSSLETKVLPNAIKLGPRISRLVSVDKPAKLPSIIGETLPEKPIFVVKNISQTLRPLIARLRLFHIAEREQLHYHHMIFSALVRMQETLTAIELLIEKDLWYQALALLRVLYEIHLNFYFDWLQPETNYQYLAAAAVFSNKDVAHQKRLMSSELIVGGVPATLAAEQANIAWKPVTYASTVADKAQLPKVGVLYHKDIYEFLSRVTHQDFEVASLHANRFDDELFKDISDDVKSTYLRFMDFVVSEFVDCIDSDIGTTITSAS